VRFLVPAFSLLLALAACQRTDPPGEAPTGVTATPGDGLAVISWDTLPDLTYWIFFQAGTSVSPTQTGATVIRRAFAPRVVAPLSNGTQYAFVMNATHDDSSAGPSSLVVTTIPRLAGANWTSGPALALPGAPPPDLKAVVFTPSRFVAVGNAVTTAAGTSPGIFAGDYSYTSDLPNPPGVAAWTPAASFPTGFASNLSAVLFNGSSFVALGNDGSVISSADGLNWSANVAVGAAGMNGLGFAFVGGVTPRYVAVGDGGNVFTSSDLATWTPATSGTGNALTSIAPLNGRFIVTGAGGIILTSPDGITWTTVNSTGATLRAAAFNANAPVVHYAAVGDAGTILTSADAVSWAPATVAPDPRNLRSVTVGGASASRFLAVGDGGVVVYSDDGLSWSVASSGVDLASVVVSPGMYLAVGATGANAVSK
jgi:hypothetical protein